MVVLDFWTINSITSTFLKTKKQVLPRINKKQSKWRSCFKKQGWLIRKQQEVYSRSCYKNNGDTSNKHCAWSNNCREENNQNTCSKSTHGKFGKISCVLLVFCRLTKKTMFSAIKASASIFWRVAVLVFDFFNFNCWKKKSCWIHMLSGSLVIEKTLGC